MIFRTGRPPPNGFRMDEREPMPVKTSAATHRKVPRRKAAGLAPARETIAAAAVELGGVERLVAWIREDAKNESVFWGSLYPKLIAVQLDGDGGGPVARELVIRFV